MPATAVALVDDIPNGIRDGTLVSTPDGPGRVRSSIADPLGPAGAAICAVRLGGTDEEVLYWEGELTRLA